MNTKILAMYLPQFHCIPENDEFWGKGFTDWVTVKKAKPLFEGHDQPHAPLDDNYYDLSDEKNVRWQCKLANKYGIYGFGIYHYWFNNDKNLLTKPAEIIRDNQDIDIHYFFAWDNGNWKRSWSNVVGNDWAPLAENAHHRNGPQILIPYILGTEKDWENHYNWLKPFFKDDRYIKMENRPVFLIYNYSPEIKKMADYWNSLAQNDGFNGIRIVYRYQEFGKLTRKGVIDNSEWQYNYEPVFSGWSDTSLFDRINTKFRKLCHLPLRKGLRVLDYDKVWENILHNARTRFKDSNFIHGGFVTYDDTPRRGSKGTLIKGSTPDKFNRYLEELIHISKQQGKEYLFLTAWNEWGEGANLEPDTINKYGYLEVINNIQQ